jgi:hypothetical protein
MKILKIISGVVLLLIVGFFSIMLFGHYSEGERAGTVSKMSKKGFVFKTYEGQLNLGGLSGETGSPASSLWSFSVSGSETGVVQSLDSALLNGKRVKIHYVEKYYTFPWQGETSYFIDKVEHIK